MVPSLIDLAIAGMCFALGSALAIIAHRMER